jgi:outer membrane protein OmpA-like peptidoglycan-associated protein
LKQDELIERNVKPLLSSVFFAENSPRIPMRYVLTADTAAFNERMLHDMPTLDAYHHVLNVIGKRMRADATARITITGCRSMARTEAMDTALSRLRAEAVRDHLASVWGIAIERMMIVARGLPEKPSNEDGEDGMAENRRVEITGDERIVGSIWTVDTTRDMASAIVEISPTVNAPHGISRSRFTVTHGSDTVSIQELVGDSIPTQMSWNVLENIERIQPEWRSLQLSFAFQDPLGVWTSADDVELPVERVLSQQQGGAVAGRRELDRFSIIAFDFNSAELNQQARSLLDRIVPYITPGADVSMTGLTDRIGSPAYNMTLSKERAKAVATYLSVSDAFARGLGSNTTFYDNDLPEGRFYSRTVLIEIWR